MNKIIMASDGRYLFFCPGCQNTHGFSDSWSFDGDFEKPTVSPSILVRGTRPLTDDEYNRVMQGEKIQPQKFVCHSFIRDGRIQFLNDCTHKLAGQTVELENYDEERI